MVQSCSRDLLRGENSVARSSMDFGISAVEFMLIVALLSVVVGSFMPQILSATQHANHDAIAQDLEQFRRQIEKYTMDHEGRRPAAGSSSSVNFAQQLQGRTSHTGVVHRDGRYGPYLIGDLPVNPVAGSSKVLVVPSPLRQHHFDGNGDHGWAYSSETGEIRANIATDVLNSEGRPLNTL